MAWHAGGRKHTLFGQDVTWLARLCPWCPCWIPPEWCRPAPALHSLTLTLRAAFLRLDAYGEPS